MLKLFATISRLVVIAALALASLSSEFAVAQSAGKHFLDLDGDSLSYEVLQSGVADDSVDDTPPLVLLGGGSGMDTRQWHLVAEPLAENHHVILFDPRGVGRSDNPTVRYSDAADFVELLDHLGIDQAIVVGLSSSGGLAFEIALRYPDRIAGVIAAGPFVRGFEFTGTMLTRLKTFSDAAKEGREPFLRAMIDEDQYFIPAPLNPSIKAFAGNVMGESYDKSAFFDESLVEVIDPPLIEQLGGIEPPVLMPIGTLDHPEVHRRNTWYMMQIPNSAEVTIADAGHNVHLENPEGFVVAIDEFLESLR
jgi:3-oxoadipate enol-lactonase